MKVSSQRFMPSGCSGGWLWGAEKLGVDMVSSKYRHLCIACRKKDDIESIVVVGLHFHIYYSNVKVLKRENLEYLDFCSLCSSAPRRISSSVRHCALNSGLRKRALAWL